MKKQAEDAIAAARSALEGTDLEAIKKETENLQQVGYKLAEVVYSTEGAQAGAAAETAESTPADDTIEADFEVVDDEENKDN